nr:biotin/lipoyl-binding protein [Delftia acidovorans]
MLVRPVNDWAEYHGRLQAPESVELRPRVSGMIDRVHFRDGARVAKGQLLFQIDARPYQAEVERLQAQLQQARAQEQRAYSESMRAERLRASNAISIELANARQTTLLEARSSISAAQARLEVARLKPGPLPPGQAGPQARRPARRPRRAAGRRTDRRQWPAADTAR